MRWIEKQPNAPTSLADFIAGQQQLGVNLSFKHFRNPAKGQFLTTLVEEQFGLCAYTGKRITDDSRKTHLEHITPQEVCKNELKAAGGTLGKDLCCDLHYTNIVAAITTEGRKGYGASVRGSWYLLDYLRPTVTTDVVRLAYTQDGRVIPRDNNDTTAEKFIKVLKLNEEVLIDERQVKITELVAVEEDGISPLEVAELEAIVLYCDTSVSGLLPEFCFAIRYVAAAYLGL